MTGAHAADASPLAQSQVDALANTAHQALHWQLLAFDALSAHILYAVLQLRSEVFVVEQTCVFQDMDGADAHALHLLGSNAQGELLAYARLLPAGKAFAEASVGRVLTRASARTGGLGHALMHQALAHLAAQWGAQPVRIGAQAHLQPFYAQHGFVDVGLPYIEDGIPHLEMLRA